MLFFQSVVVQIRNIKTKHVLSKEERRDYNILRFELAEEEHYETSSVQCCFIQHSIWLISQCYINWITFRIFRVDFAITKDGIRQMTKVKTEVQNSSEEFTTKANMLVSIKSKILIEAKRLMLILSAPYLKI